MHPQSPVISDESKNYGSRRKDIIKKSNKRREITVKNKAHHAPLERVHIQTMSIHAEDFYKAHVSVSEFVCIKKTSIQA